MATNHYFAFYGSLRRGMKLYEQYAGDLTYHFSAWLPGFDLYSLGPYPYAIRSDAPSSKTKVEIFSIASEEVRAQIHQIELNAGYYFEEVMIGGLHARLYVYKMGTNDQKVTGGDWVDFFRS